MTVEEFASKNYLMAALADAVADRLEAKLSSTGRASLAVPGGTTPGPFFDSLSNKDLDWENVTITLGDERFVPEDSDRSNTALIKKRLLCNKAKDARLLRLYQKAADPEEVLDALSAQFDGILPLTVNVLGMGADMHTASLFPDSPELSAALNSDDVLAVVRPSSQPEARVTLTGPVLAGAKSIFILITGEEKRAALDKALTLKDPYVAPISLVLGLPQTRVFYAA
ncbi:MAG: 6-phosphogluconolactonase [Pseudomonadota bacterium]